MGAVHPRLWSFLQDEHERKANIMTSIIFVVGFLVSLSVCYALFAYTIHEMGTNEKTNNTTSNTTPELIKQAIK
jgi:hypothetical protein